jgi:hypothetical protein
MIEHREIDGLAGHGEPHERQYHGHAAVVVRVPEHVEVVEVAGSFHRRERRVSVIGGHARRQAREEDDGCHCHGER